MDSTSQKLSSSYKLLDTGDFLKLEKLGELTIIRPAPAAIWKKSLPRRIWDEAAFEFRRYQGGDGKWFTLGKKREIPSDIILNGIRFALKLTDFGHLGIFAEHAEHWQSLQNLVKKYQKKSNEPFKALNLFAYTGGASLALAKVGAEVVHLDASKTSVDWAKQNLSLNGMEKAPMRFIVDDVQKFVAREIRRGSQYNGIILDPPSFGRGLKGEVWKIEEHLEPLLQNIKQIICQNPSFIFLTGHTPGFGPLSLQNLLQQVFSDSFSAYSSGEMFIPGSSGSFPLPSGAFALGC